MYTFSKEGQSGILDKNGQELVGLDNNFQELHPLEDDFLGVKIDGKFGFVDVLGRLRIANRYDSVTHFHHGMAAVKVLGRWGYINKSERIIVQPRFACAYPFRGAYGYCEKKWQVRHGQHAGQDNHSGGLRTHHPHRFGQLCTAPAKTTRPTNGTRQCHRKAADFSLSTTRWKT